MGNENDNVCDDKDKCKKKNNWNSTLWTVLIVVTIIVLIILAIYFIIKMMAWARIYSTAKQIGYQSQGLIDNLSSRWNSIEFRVNNR